MPTSFRQGGFFVKDIFEGIEPMVYQGRINVPYNWWAGDTASKFLLAIRDERKILGTRCGKCNRVFVPPRKTCPTCFTENGEWVNVSDVGIVKAFTVARRQLAALPGKVPVCFGLIELEGADTALLHYLGEVEPDEIKIGMRVQACFAEERQGLITDIEYFRPV
jgi:uncharacterized OB-fold protein